MCSNDYRLWYRDKRDSVYVKRGTVPVSALDGIELAWTELFLGVRRWKKKLLRFLKGLVASRRCV
jgi:hypothetical protein